MHNGVPTVLIIDNDEAMVTALSARLDAGGYICETACSGAQGLAAFKRASIDLVITDLNMPSGDGIALSRAIRRVSEVPIIVLTGFHDEFRRELRDVSGVSVVHKPCVPSVLMELVEAELALSGISPPGMV